MVLKAPHLRNVNQEALNFPYIDLADDQCRLAIQVTTERGAGKVTETLAGFTKQRYQERYDRLVFFILTGNKISYAPRSQQRWQRICEGRLRFDPRKDILTTLDLFPMIRGLPHPEIYAVHDIISRTVIGEAYVDVDSYLTALSSRQLEDEKRSGKYIPDIFVETRETKNLARSFSHPALFFHRTLDSLSRLDISGWNKRLAKAGLPSLPFPELGSYSSARELADVDTTAARLSAQLAELTDILDKYKEVGRDGAPPFPVREERKYYYDENLYTLEGWLGISFNIRVGDLADEVRAARARIFILTGRAGQGKTNLVCDFVENFLFRHKIPCAYLTGRRLRSTHAPDLGDAIRGILFEGAIASFAEAAELLSAHATRVNKPFVLIIDGLNEHHRIREFAEQLEHFIRTALSYPNLKLFLTCRSEFFKDRFGNLTADTLKQHLFLCEANERRLDEESYADMLAGYFRFFGIRRDRVSEEALRWLRQDILLLRFFCEAYGTRNKKPGYVQPYVVGIYREEIFDIYLETKLEMAEGFFKVLTEQVKLTGHKGDLLKVLLLCLELMLANWQFSNVPVSAIPSELQPALYALLDEELILRRDVPPSPSALGAAEETVNFTFDDFRDFLLAQFLVYRVYPSDPAKCEALIARNDPKDSQVVEGLKKFLFYASRHADNEEFWRFYSRHAWYKDVYDYEVFNIDPRLLRPDDREVVVAGLNAATDLVPGHSERGRLLARHLARRWHRDEHRVLNLDLLLSVVTQAGDLAFDHLITAPFKTYAHYHDGLSASAFCKFITEAILPEFRPGADAPETALFRFLILLLPVDSGTDLNSESFQICRKLLELHPAYGITLLKESLEYRPTQHRPFVWRLLSLAAGGLSASDPLLQQAEIEQAESATADLRLHREVSRFLDRYLHSVPQAKP